MENIEHVIDGCECIGKRCKDCQQVKCTGAFHKVGKKDKKYLHTYCILCCRDRDAKYREEHGERIRAQQRKALRENESRIAKRLEYVKTHVEEQKIWHAEHYQKNREHVRVRTKTYRQTHREEIRIRHQVEAAHRRAKKYQAPGSFTKQEWLDLKTRYNHICLYCGKQEPEIILTIDHVIPFSQGGSNNIANIQPLCKSCNAVKNDNIVDYRSTWQDSQEAG